MIALAADCLVFRLANGESVPLSAEMISVELADDTAQWFDEEFVRHAANAVFHYFQRELGRHSVTLSDFARALERVLRGFKQDFSAPALVAPVPGVLKLDLDRLARESGEGCELFFFPRLRDELRQQLRHAPHTLRFHGLRGCVKLLAGTRRWSRRCRDLEDQLVAYLRQCLSAEAPHGRVSLVVE